MSSCGCRNVGNVVGVKDATGEPGRDGAADRGHRRRLRGVQRRRHVHAAAARRRRRRCHQRGVALGDARTSSSCSTPGTVATRRRRGGSTPACSRASRSRRATSRPTRARPRRCCATSASRRDTAGHRWAPTRTGSNREPPRSTSAWSPLVADRPRPEQPASDAVRIVFLGGLGEIGRNCAVIEVGGGPSGDGPDRKLLLIDCGLMFPDPDMHGIDLVLPDFTYLRENADRIVAVVATHGHEDHVGALQFLLREMSVPVYGSALTLGLARNRIEEAGLLGKTELHAVADGERRADRPVRRRVHPGHPQRPARPRDRGAHAAGRHPAHRRLQARPHAGRRPAYRPRPHRPARQDGEGIRVLLRRLDERRGGRARPERDERRLGAALAVRGVPRIGASSRRASPAISTASSRSPTPRSTAAGSSRRSA